MAALAAHWGLRRPRKPHPVRRTRQSPDRKGEKPRCRKWDEVSLRVERECEVHGFER